jgi:hypothetical protein
MVLLYRHVSEGTEENQENISQVSQSPGPDLNPGPPDYEPGVLTILPRCSVIVCEISQT